MKRFSLPLKGRTIRRLAGGMLAVALLAGLAQGCKRGEADDKDKKDPPVPVQVMTLEPGPIARVLRYDADVRGELEVRVFSQVPERILQLKIEEGDLVRKGQVLALVRSETLDDGVRSARAALKAARADRDYVKTELDRQSKLLARKVVSQAMVDQLRSRLLAAEAQIARLRAMADQASTFKSNAVIRSPIAGVIGQRFLSQGDMVAPTLPICTVVLMDRVELMVEVPEGDLARIRDGMAARLTVARYPGRTFDGKVQRISPTIDRMTRTARVKVVADNPKHELMPGMLARVLVEVERRDQTLVVPYSSLVIRMGAGGKTEHHAFVNSGGKAVERQLTIGIVEGKKVEVLKGLAAGETLVSQGQHLLQPGRKLRVVERLHSDGRVVKVKAKEEGKASAAAGSRS